MKKILQMQLRDSELKDLSEKIYLESTPIKDAIRPMLPLLIEDFNSGNFKPMEKERLNTFPFKIEVEILEGLQKIAKQYKLTLTELIIQHIEWSVNNND